LLKPKIQNIYSEPKIKDIFSVAGNISYARAYTYDRAYMIKMRRLVY